MCLIGAFQWGRLTEPLSVRANERATAGFIALAGISLLILLPIHAWQAHATVSPFAAAEASIRRARTDVVMVDSAGGWFTFDLTRNDPYLTNRPIELDLEYLTDAQLKDICSRFSVSFFGNAEAARFGIPTSPLHHDPRRASCRNQRAAVPLH